MRETLAFSTRCQDVGSRFDRPAGIHLCYQIAPRSTKIASDSRIRSEVSSSQDLMEARLGQISWQRIPISEKMKWAADISPVSRQICNSVRGLNAGSTPSHQHVLISGCAPESDGHLSINRNRSDSQRVEDNGWTEVKPRYWWRKNQGNLGKSQQQVDAKGSCLFKSKLQGKCFNCLSSNHYAFRCSTATRCWFCLQTGHRARLSPRKGYLSKSNSTHTYPISVKYSSQSTGNYSSTYLQPAPSINPLHKGQVL